MIFLALFFFVFHVTTGPVTKVANISGPWTIMATTTIPQGEKGHDIPFTFEVTVNGKPVTDKMARTTSPNNKITPHMILSLSLNKGDVVGVAVDGDVTPSAFTLDIHNQSQGKQQPAGG